MNMDHEENSAVTQKTATSVENQENIDSPAVETESKKSESQLNQEKLKAHIISLEQKIDQLEQEKKLANDKFLRNYADFENYRKRMIKERSDTIFSTQRNLLFEILPVLDDLERAMISIEQTTKNENENPQIALSKMLEGVRLVCKQFAFCLSKIGLEPINAKGKPFDPTLHEAIQFIPVPMNEKTGETEQVLEEMVKGYRLQDRLLRPSKVVVSKPEPINVSASSENNGNGKSPQSSVE